MERHVIDVAPADDLPDIVDRHRFGRLAAE
jgi:hypothetical protein